MTEKSYVDGLSVIVDVYMNPLLEAQAKGKVGISATDLRNLFPGLP